MNISAIVKKHLLDIDDDDESDIDWFMSKIELTDEYQSQVINPNDFDFGDLLHAIASDGDVDDEIECLKTAIRESAKELYQSVMLDLVADAQDEKDAHGDYLYELQQQAKIDREDLR